MSTFNRRQFLRRGVLAVVAVVCFQQAQARTPPQPGAELPELPQGKSPQKVIIIGAGMAGLVAAYELIAAGHHVIVLEARERIGGRVLTLQDQFHENSLLEAGAARIPPDHRLTLSYIRHFNLALTPFSPSTGKYIMVKDGKKQFVEAANLFPMSPVRVEDIQKISDGFDQLSLAFAKGMMDKIKLGDPVTHVSQTASVVNVRCQSGKEYVGDSVLCTVPLTVMDKIIFNPPLSLEKQEAMAGGYDYRAATRVFVECSDRFWEKDGLNGWGMLTDEELWNPNWDHPKERGILQAYLKGDKALGIDSITNPKDKRAYLLAQWEHFLPGASRYSLGAMSYSWSQDRWAKGGWAYPTKSQEKQLFNELGKPEGRIFFAGEHTANTRGWIQGALESGLQAAQSIHFLGMDEDV